MSTEILDTHRFIKRLVVPGMPEQQAEILADEHARPLNERLATKLDLEKLRAELQRYMTELKAGMLQWVAGMLVAQAAIIASPVKLL
jgi:hypothetical protein